MIGVTILVLLWESIIHKRTFITNQEDEALKQEATMQQTQDIIEALRTDLAELTALHAPSGSERPVIARLRELFAPLVDEVKVDHMGNLTATRKGSGPHIV